MVKHVPELHTSREDPLRTAEVLMLAEARAKRASQGADLRKRGVGPVGFEPRPANW